MRNYLFTHANFEHLSDGLVVLIGNTYGEFSENPDIPRLQTAVAAHTQNSEVCGEFISVFFGELRKRYLKLTAKK